MKISEIKDKELRELAELRSSEQPEWESDYVHGAFNWNCTKEGNEFWDNVYNGVIRSLSTMTPIDFILKEQNNVLLQDYTLQELEWFMLKYAEYDYEVKSKIKESL